MLLSDQQLLCAQLVFEAVDPLSLYVDHHLFGVQLVLVLQDIALVVLLVLLELEVLDDLRVCLKQLFMEHLKVGEQQQLAQLMLLALEAVVGLKVAIDNIKLVADYHNSVVDLVGDLRNRRRVIDQLQFPQI